MGFLKQLLTPFVEFEDSKKNPGEVKPASSGTTPAGASTGPSNAGARGSQPGALPTSPGSSGTTTSAGAAPEVVHHPLVDEGSKPPEALKQVPAYSPGGTITGAMPEHEQYFEKLIEEANIKNPIFQGADYKEFVDSKIDIDDITDEAIKYRTAFNILKGSGLTREKLLSTGQEYLNLIGRDLNAFQGAHALQYKKEVGQKELIIDKKVQELQALTIKINALKQEINQATSEISLTKEKMNTVKNSFLLAGEKKQKEIQTELDKIAQYF